MKSYRKAEMSSPIWRQRRKPAHQVGTYVLAKNHVDGTETCLFMGQPLMWSLGRLSPTAKACCRQSFYEPAGALVGRLPCELALGSIEWCERLESRACQELAILACRFWTLDWLACWRNGVAVGLIDKSQAHDSPDRPLHQERKA